MSEGRVFGYARVSSREQNLDRQIMALEKYVPSDQIVSDKASGKDTDRPAYQALKGVLGLRDGDTLFITSLDRLSRNKSDIRKELEWYKNKHIRLKILDLPTSLIEVPEGQEWILDMINNILIEVLASIAEQERQTIRKRQREGIEAARKKGKHLGRPPIRIPAGFEAYYDKWKRKEMTAVDVMRHTGLKKSSFYKLVKMYEERRI